MLTTAKLCKQKFFREYIERRATKAQSVHLVAGGALAQAFETFRKEYYTPDRPLSGDVEACRAAAARDLIHYWGTYEPHEKETKSLANVLLAFWDYFTAYPPENDRLKPLMLANGPAIEWSFGEPLPIPHPVTGEPLVYAGRFDMFGTLGDAVYVVDEKSTSRIGNEWSAQWRLRYQFLGYVWAARQNGFKPWGAIVRGIGIYTSKSAYPQAIMNYPQHLIDRWYETMLRDVQATVDAWKENYWNYDFGHSCMSFNKPCEFMDLCSSKNPSVYYGDFTERLWNPLEKDPTKVRELLHA